MRRLSQKQLLPSRRKSSQWRFGLPFIRTRLFKTQPEDYFQEGEK